MVGTTMSKVRLFFTLLLLAAEQANGCNFYPVGEYLRFVRIPENLKVGDEVLNVEVHPKRNLSIQPAEREEDALFFTHRDLNRTHVSVILAQSLEDLVDSDSPQNVVKFRLGCEYEDGDDTISAYLSITVYVEDVNDHSPIFQNVPYEVNVDELTPVGLTIFKNIHAFDRDKPNTPNSDIQYAITGGNDKEKFTLESSHKPALVLKKPLDYDSGDKDFEIIVTASDRGTLPRSTNSTVHVIINDNDDLPPKFTQDVYRTQIQEFHPILDKKIHKELVFKEAIAAFDQDFGIGAAIKYDLVAGNERRLFSLDSNNASLFLNKEIDLDAETGLPGNTFVLQIQAAQTDNPLKTAQARAEIEILDLNDNLPEFEVDFYNISIVENLPNGFSVLQVMASDRDQGDNGEFTYQLQDFNGAFAIDPRTGWLTVRNQSVLDREQHSSLKMKVYAKEKNPSVLGNNNDRNRMSKWRRTPTTQRPQPFKDKTLYVFPDKTGNINNIEYFEESNDLMSFVSVEVTLLDANDNNPVFLPSNLYEFTMKSNAKIGSVIGKVKAIDPDLGRNGIVFYDLQRTSNLTVTSPFQVDAKTGAITIVESPLVQGRHALFIEASDQPVNPSERRYSLAVVTVDVVNPTKSSNPEKPGFIGAPYEFWVGSNVGIGTSVGQIRLNDGMDKSEVVYDLLHSYIEGVPFAVEERSGTITVVDDLARFNRPLFDFEAVATQDNINVTLITNATIHVVDVNDERGLLLKSAHTSLVFHVKENTAGAKIGQVLLRGSTHSPLNNSKSITFIIANQQDITEDIDIDQDGTIVTQKPLDREKRDVYHLTVIAEFYKGLISGAGIYQVTVHVDDENDNPPVFTHSNYEGNILENSPKGTEVNMSMVISATDADIGSNALFAYTLFGDGHELFAVDQKKGTVNFIGTKLDREEKNMYLLKIVARDKGNLSSEAKITIFIDDENDNIPKISQLIVPQGENVDLLENDEKTHVKIYRESKNETLGTFSKIEMKPKNKFSAISENQGPIFDVLENIAVGSVIIKLEASDLDAGTNSLVRFEFVSEVFKPIYPVLKPGAKTKRFFVINERQGHVIVARSLPPESEFRLNISAIDGGGLMSNMTIRFYIKDVNDHPPTFKKSWYSFDVDEAQYSRRVLGKIDASDADFGQNSNVTYQIDPLYRDLPFEISPLSGVFSVNGELDRENKDRYLFSVIANDNGSNQKLSSTVSVEVQVLDVNDNEPLFYGYDEIIQWKHPEADTLANHNFESVMLMPIYRATLDENSPIGTTVTKVFANDSDFAGNGNGLLLYNLPQRKNQVHLFNIDSKDGVITTAGKLDYETQAVHNVTVVASDLGSPSLSSTAMLFLTVNDVPDEEEISEKPVFISRYYEVEVDENAKTPVELVTVNLTEYYENFKMKYSIVNDDNSDIKKMFTIDPRNGTLYLIRSPDRETKDLYRIIIRAERQKTSRNMPHVIYPVSDEILEGMTKFEVKVIVKIKDINDNSPKFTNNGRPMVTAIPTTAAFGYQVIKLQATDIDTGINADIRYQIINDQSQRFVIDAISGQVRAVAPFTRDAGRVFGFDVKATDKRGADDGRSAIANVFVYVLDENKQLILLMGSKPTEVERGMENITKALSSVTGFDVRVRRLEANPRTLMEGAATDMYVYAVDPLSNAIIDMDILLKSLLIKEAELKHELMNYKILEIGGTSIAQARHGKLLSTMEISVVALGCFVFVGAFVTAICILCVRKTRRKHHKPYSQQNFNAFSTDHFPKFGSLFPSGGNQCQEINQSYSEADSYIDVVSSGNVKKICPHGHSIEEFGKAHQKCIKGSYTDLHSNNFFSQKHENMCIKFNQRPLNKKRKKQETSVTSINSSGQDSGIAEATRCPCGHSNTQTSEDSSGASYEDSLKSNLNNEPRKQSYHLHQIDKADNYKFSRRASIGHQPFEVRRLNNTRQSFSENLIQKVPLPPVPFERIGSGDGRMKRQISTPNISIVQPHHSQPYFLNNKRIQKRKDPREEPVIDYDHSDGEEVFMDDRVHRLDNKRLSKNKKGRRNSKLLELSGQTAVFVATPAAAEIMRRHGSERLVLARPL